MSEEENVMGYRAGRKSSNYTNECAASGPGFLSRSIGLLAYVIARRIVVADPELGFVLAEGHGTA